MTGGGTSVVSFEMAAAWETGADDGWRLGMMCLSNWLEDADEAHRDFLRKTCPRLQTRAASAQTDTDDLNPPESGKSVKAVPEKHR